MKKMSESVKKRTRSHDPALIFDACKTGSLSLLNDLLESGHNPNVVDELGDSPLMWVCNGNSGKDMLAMVKLLLEYGALTDIQDAKGRTALHFAAASDTASSNVVQMLVGASHCIDAMDVNGETPLIFCLRRRCIYSEERDAIVTILLLNGARGQCFKHNALHLACLYGSVNTVDLIMSCTGERVDVEARDEKDRTPLICAVYNMQHDIAIMDRLIETYKCNVKAVDSQGRNVLYHAYRNSTAAFVHLKRYFAPANLSLGDTFPTNTGDPIGLFREAAAYKPTISSKTFQTAVQGGPPNTAWAMMRCLPGIALDNTVNDFFTLISKSTDVEMWFRFAVEYGGMRHPFTGNTLLHMAARYANLAILDMLTRRFFINPFVRNSQGCLAADIAFDRHGSKLLQDYAAFRPTVWHARWYGPFFCARAKTWLLILNREAIQGRKFPKDVALYILKKLAEMEYV